MLFIGGDRLKTDELRLNRGGGVVVNIHAALVIGVRWSAKESGKNNKKSKKKIEPGGLVVSLSSHSLDALPLSPARRV